MAAACGTERHGGRVNVVDVSTYESTTDEDATWLLVLQLVIPFRLLGCDRAGDDSSKSARHVGWLEHHIIIHCRAHDSSIATLFPSSSFSQ